MAINQCEATAMLSGNPEEGLNTLNDIENQSLIIDCRHFEMSGFSKRVEFGSSNKNTRNNQ